MNKLPPWSYSMLDMFDNCNKQAFHRYILKEKGVETEAQRKGNLFDKAVEDRINKGTPLPEEFAQHEGYAASVANMAKAECSIYTQLKLGITRDFRPCGFFADDVWGRGVLDVGIVKRKSLNRPEDSNIAIITDWKTGKNSENKPYSNKGLQLKIFTALMFKSFPGIEKITAFNLWLKTGEIGMPWVFTRADEPTLWREILPRVMKMEQAFATGEWPATPGPLCGYCSVLTCPNNKK